ncbi:MAG: trigger factor [Candidatus Paceibacterota bacterium]
MEPLSKNISVNNTGDSEVEISAEIPAEEMKNQYSESLKEAQKDAEVDGFRKGKAPLEMVEKQVGQGFLMQKAAEKILQEEYPRILSSEKIEPIGQPQVTITKIAPGSDLGFKIKTATMPEVELGDYKEAAKRALKENPLSEDPEVTQEEMDETVYNIRASQLLEEKRQKGEEVPSPESLKEEDLPALTDEFVSSLGEFSNLDDFHKKIKEHLERQKRNKEQEKQWAAILDAVIEESNITIPSVLVESELDKMTAQLKDDVQRAGLEFSDYLSKVQKTEEDIRAEWKENAAKRAKTQLILNTIAEKEEIIPDPEVVEEQVNQVLEHYKEANPESVRVFVKTQITNEKTLAFLASLGDKDKSANHEEKGAGGNEKEADTKQKEKEDEESEEN